MSKTMSQEKKESERAPGTTTIAPNVLVTIAQLAALRVEGVAGLAPLPPSVNRLFRRGIGDGVSIEVKNGMVSAELFLVYEPNINMRDTSRQVQESVARAIEEMVGMAADKIDIHIQDVAYGENEE
jgi:uncharacterized alkaline shock family protein YloU